MIVRIQNDNNDNAPEWALLELNGELVEPTETPKAENDENHNELIGSDRVELGALRFTQEVSIQRHVQIFVSLFVPMLTYFMRVGYWQGKPIMVLGSHELKGEVLTLKEPFCVMKKRKRDDKVDYKVAGVVTKKILFNQYPKSIMR